ncbi:hypothetical protein ACHAXA_006246 [Cyclostephanos tholiformis]|uniref:Uncharacterized protein n=1 Tax=Cyclostephanos tholiformis TaxID=382380 RepID=A0ABD3SEL0_9STRA
MMYLAAMILLASISRAHSTSSSSSCFVSSSVTVRRFIFSSNNPPSSAVSSSSLLLSSSRSRRDRRCPRGEYLSSSSSSDGERTEQINVSRLSTLQTLLSMRGAPGSVGCNLGNGDLVAISPSSLSSSEYRDLHPHLLPLAKSVSSGHVVCALRRGYADDVEYFDTPALLARPWPIVESAVGLPGMRLLSLNSEHLMRRIAADADSSCGDQDNDDGVARRIVETYNDGLGCGNLSEKSMDEPYVTGSVAKLGYGLDKYVLLRVGPFPDLYETMSNNHLMKGDLESSLIAAEACNGKFGGRFGSTFTFYAKLLGSLSPRRDEECRDAARMTLRMPLPTLGLKRGDYVEVARMAGYASTDDDGDFAMAKMLEMYEKIREHEGNDNSGDKTPKQKAIEDADYVLDVACLTGRGYGNVRAEVAAIYREAGMEEDARFVERCS